jgi:hypothetical protein
LQENGGDDQEEGYDDKDDEVRRASIVRRRGARGGLSGLQLPFFFAICMNVDDW